ncbi:MAG: tRNA (N6-isopentenyl adenosine(37)-C2)-methylthiotransferase MiaB [Clostridiales bacterium]|nr:tRNA (N6-isopentenyl adenosine(37)-C2)-methylthiotransferase MiaB [Clostridiales bacterium]
MHYLIKTYGCQMNIHESEKIAGILEKLGYSETQEEKQSDVIVFNTCCIRETAEAKINGHIGEIKKYKERNSDLIVAVCGCMSQQKGVAENLKKRFPFIDIILGTANLNLLEEQILKVRNSRRHQTLIDVNEFGIDENIPVYRTSGTNAWVNIIYGCNNFCTYCIVPYVRGRERSRQAETIINEVKQLVAEGYKEITLLGQNVNSYGKDLEDGSSFAKLLDELGKIEGNYKLRFMTSHPRDFTDDVIDAIARNPKVCHTIHLPIQSGSDHMLKVMNRHYDKAHYLNLVKKIREKIPDVGLTTDIMVGFAGETEEDFLETLELVKQVRFSGIFTFIYSRRKGTPGYDMPNQVPQAVKKDRIKRLIATQNVIVKEISKDHEGKVFEIIVEGKNSKYADGTYCGRTDDGRLVNFKSDVDLTGEIVKVKIKTSKSATLWGDIV